MIEANIDFNFEYKTKTLPDILYIEDKCSNYCVGYRNLKFVSEYDEFPDTFFTLYRTDKINIPGTEVWVCLDISNGNPEIQSGKVYVWVFETLTEAFEQYKKHQETDCYSNLEHPIRCLIVDKFTLPLT